MEKAALEFRGPNIIPGDTPRRDGWPAPTVTLSGAARSAPLSPDGFPLWLVGGVLDDGAALTWSDAHGDEVLHVTRGELAVDGRVCPTGGAVIVESGVVTTVRAVGEAEVLHFGPADLAPPADGFYGPAATEGHGVHVVGPGGTFAQVEGARDTRFFADSTCPTCRLTLLHTGRSEAYESAPHSHSQDELIHVLRGELQLGAYRVGPGDTLAIAKDVRYRFRSDGFAFVNYRRDVSHQTIDRDAPPILEGGEVHGFTPVMDLR
jgi:mannose-6-phosphate isomerase-like protein (cupin superfamily)